MSPLEIKQKCKEIQDLDRQQICELTNSKDYKELDKQTKSFLVAAIELKMSSVVEKAPVVDFQKLVKAYIKELK